MNDILLNKFAAEKFTYLLMVLFCILVTVHFGFSIILEAVTIRLPGERQPFTSSNNNTPHGSGFCASSRSNNSIDR